MDPEITDHDEENQFADLAAKLRELPVASMRRRAVWSLNLALGRRLIAANAPSFPDLRVPRLAAVVALLVVMIVSVPAYAYTSDHVTLDSPLYPIKTGIERVELALALEPAAQAAAYDKLAQRRLDEGAYLAAQTTPSAAAIAKTVDSARTYVEKANAIQATTSAIVRERQQVQLTRIAAAVGIAGDEAVVESVSLAIEAAKRRGPERRPRPGRIDIGSGAEADSGLSAPAAAPADTDGARSDTAKTATGTKATTTPLNALERIRRVFRSNRGHRGEAEAPEGRAIDRRAEERKITAPRTEPSMPADSDENRFEDLAVLKERIETLRTQITADKFDQDSIDRLFGQLERRYQAAAEAVGSGDKNADVLLRAAEAVTSNAKRFLRPLEMGINEGKSKDIDQEENINDALESTENEHVERNQTKQNRKNERHN